MYCKNCGHEMAENQDVCLNCGVRKGVGTCYCPNCGNPIAQGAAFCTNCGVSVETQNNPSQYQNQNQNQNQNYLNGRDKTTMIIICLFLGSLGVHNFMMGETKKGVLKIALTLCFGLGFIFAIIDLVKIATDSYVVDPEKLI